MRNITRDMNQYGCWGSQKNECCLSVKESRTAVTKRAHVQLDWPARRARTRTLGKAKQGSSAVSKTACWDTPGSADQIRSCSAAAAGMLGGADDRLP
ncbi:hypothetical protein AOLI_G00062680 [Acnodon oligacanthus]